MITRVTPLSGVLAVALLSIGCQTTDMVLISKDQAIARANRDAVQPVPEVGLQQARIDSVTAELTTLGEADRRVRAQRGPSGYRPGQTAESPVWWVTVRGYFQYQGMAAPPNPAPICEADERDFVFDAQIGESIAGRMPNTRCE